MDFDNIRIFDAFSSVTIPEAALAGEQSHEPTSTDVQTADDATQQQQQQQQETSVAKKMKIDNNAFSATDLPVENLTASNPPANHPLSVFSSSTFSRTGFTFQKGHVDILDVEKADGCRHDVVVPQGLSYTPISEFPFTKKNAKTYPFTLDPFQAHGVQSLEKHESVLISAHTSAGKTVLAEYAIAMSIRDNQRVIYTTPIKALSNQKFREFTEEFKDVGLMTGDVTLNPNASIMVMTTEILRNMLYKGNDLIKETKWIIFDEIHYMRDRERGVVWEETLILFSSETRFVFLSATIPNSTEFASWIAQLHRQVCHVIYTEYRPTPLQHYLFPAGCDGLYMVVDQNGTFKEDNYDKAMAALTENIEQKKMTSAASSRATASGGVGGGTDHHKLVGDVQSDIYKLVKMTMDRKLMPVICFSFSKRECEKNAIQIAALSLNTKEEVKLITEIYTNALQILSEEDRQLPQVVHLLPLLQKGIGIHHSGLLPFLKELVEILFQENLLKILFATETFAMGLNMPARTVIFTTITKYDGKIERVLTGGEYIQMSGRAGRRGLDDKGIVVQMVKEQLKKPVAVNLLKGKSDKLFSAFHITYNMLLNLLRIDELSAEYILERSFHQFQNVENVPMLQAKEAKLMQRIQQLTADNEEPVEDYYLIREQIEKLSNIMNSVVFSPDYLLPYLQPGRLVHLGALANLSRVNSTGEDLNAQTTSPYTLYESLESQIIACEVHEMDDLLSDAHLINSLDTQITTTGKQVDSHGSSAIPLGWGIVIGFQKKKVSGGTSSTTVGATHLSNTSSGSEPADMESTAKEAGFIYIAEVLVCLGPDSTEKVPMYAKPGEGEPRVIPVVIQLINKISAVRIKLPRDLSSPEGLKSTYSFLLETLKRFHGSLPLLDPIEDMKVDNPTFLQSASRIELLEKRLFKIPLYTEIQALHQNETTQNQQKNKLNIALNKEAEKESDVLIESLQPEGYSADLEPLMAVMRYRLKVKLQGLQRGIQLKIKDTMNLLQMNDLKARKRILRRLGFTSSSDNIELKGRVACEISSSDPILLTELIFSGIFADLTPELTAAVLSCFVFDESGSSSLTAGIKLGQSNKPKINTNAFDVNYGMQVGSPNDNKLISQEMREQLHNVLEKVEETARHIAKISNESDLQIHPDDYVGSFSNQLVLPVLVWALGGSFGEMKNLTKAFEGSIIRALRRLDEMLRQLCAAAQVIGNPELYTTFQIASEKIKRGIIFAASLYL